MPCPKKLRNTTAIIYLAAFPTLPRVAPQQGRHDADDVYAVDDDDGDDDDGGDGDYDDEDF
jgi:hypothetical protein